MISTFFIHRRTSLHFYILCVILMVTPKPNFRSKMFLKIFFGGNLCIQLDRWQRCSDCPSLRFVYYDRQGWRTSIRESASAKFGEAEIEVLRVIECLKKAGMEIRRFGGSRIGAWRGPAAYPRRKAVFEVQRKHGGRQTFRAFGAYEGRSKTAVRTD